MVLSLFGDLGDFNRSSLFQLDVSCKHCPAIAGNVEQVPASFTYALCGYRPDQRHPDIPTDKPNMSDASEAQSVELSRALLDTLGVPQDKIAPSDPGNELEEEIVRHLKALRSDLHIKRGRRAHEFIQYAHLDVFPNSRKTFQDVRPTVARLSERVRAVDLGRARTRIEKDLDKLTASTDQQAVLVSDLAEQMPTESLLRIDVSVAIHTRASWTNSRLRSHRNGL